MLAGGTAGAQLIVVLASPILTRLYTPADFGILAVYTGLLSILAVIACLRYELALPLAQTQDEAVELFALAIIALSGISVLSLILVWCAGDLLASLLGIHESSSYLWFIPVGVATSGIYGVLSYWSIRAKAFEAIASSKVSQSISTISVQTLGNNFGTVSLVIGQIVGQFIACIRLAKATPGFNEISSITIKGLIQVASRYRQFPLYSTWSGLFNVAGSQIPPILFAAFFGAGTAGLYSLANRVLMLPSIIVGTALGQVYYPTLVEVKGTPDFANHIRQGAIALFKVSIPIAAVFMLFSPNAFMFVFGEDWFEAGLIARWMTPWIVFQFICSPLSMVYLALEKENLGLFFQVSMFIFRVLAAILGYMYFDLNGALILFFTISAACYIAYFFSILSLSAVGVGTVAVAFTKELVVTFLIIVPTLLLYKYTSSLPAFYFSIAALALLYFKRIRSLYYDGQSLRRK